MGGGTARRSTLDYHRGTTVNKAMTMSDFDDMFSNIDRTVNEALMVASSVQPDALANVRENLRQERKQLAEELTIRAQRMARAWAKNARLVGEDDLERLADCSGRLQLTKRRLLVVALVERLMADPLIEMRHRD